MDGLFVTESNHSALLDAVARDKPTVLFWTPALNELRPSAQPYFDRLLEVGVMHHSPESAADHVGRVHADPLAWWWSPVVKAAVEGFCRQFAYQPENTVGEWSAALRRLATRSAILATAAARARLAEDEARTWARPISRRR